MTKVKVIARVRRFVQGEKPDSTLVVGKDGALSVGDVRNPNQRTSYPYVFTAFLRACCQNLTTLGSEFATVYDGESTHEQVFEDQVRAMLSSVYQGLVSPQRSQRVWVLIQLGSDADYFHVLLWCQQFWEDDDHDRR